MNTIYWVFSILFLLVIVPAIYYLFKNDTVYPPLPDPNSKYPNIIEILYGYRVDINKCEVFYSGSGILLLKTKNGNFLHWTRYTSDQGGGFDYKHISGWDAMMLLLDTVGAETASKYFPQLLDFKNQI